MPPISFKASLITSVDIKKKRTEKSFRDCRANLVELDPKNTKDVEALAHIACDWEHDASTFAPSIYNEALKKNNYPDVQREHYYAVTTQKRRFENLDPKKVLGVTLFSEKKANENEITWVQVVPAQNYDSRDRQYKRIGVSMLDFLKQAYPEKPIYVQSADSAVNFYSGNNFFKKPGGNNSELIWQA